MLVNLLASVTAGAISNTLTAPIWTIRTRMMTQINHEDYRNSFHAATKIYRQEGLYALFRGVVPSMWGLVSILRKNEGLSRGMTMRLLFLVPDPCGYSISSV